MERTVADNVLEVLQHKGIITEAQRRELQPDIEQVTKADHIPGGPLVTGRVLINMRPADPGLRCGCRSSFDPQSGWIFCGRPAEWMADWEGHESASVCGLHKSRLEAFLK